jgi:hypothetical protein
MKRRATKTSKSSAQEVGLRLGFRSGLEEVVAEQIKLCGHMVRFETTKVEYVKPSKPSKYTPDFVLDNGIIVETKGRFETADRQKHLLIKEQHPKLDIRFVFSNSNQRIRKGSETRYADWCRKHGFQFADKRIPAAWFNEAPLVKK